jgi:glycosyltransferase involved in cell wall biosynthesis
MLSSEKIRVLVLARNFPNPSFPTLGLWTKRMIDCTSGFAEPTVVAPLPWAPPLILEHWWGRYRAVPRLRTEIDDDSYRVFHPRIPWPPGQLLDRYHASIALPFVERLARQLHSMAHFHLIHTHFIYPDGVIGALLGSRLRLPVVTTEGAAWFPWLTEAPAVRRRVLDVLDNISLFLPVSRWQQSNMEKLAPIAARCRIVPNVLDERVFRPKAQQRWNPDRILFVGLIRRVKGLDILVRALPPLLAKRPRLKLAVVGGAFYRSYSRELSRIRALADALRVSGSIDFLGELDPTAVADAMRSSAVVVVPSRRETFSAVCVEAVAVGTPVVATRCGGPEEIVDQSTGFLVPPEDPGALALAIDHAIKARGNFHAETMHTSVAQRFGRNAVASLLRAAYQEALDTFIAR